MSDTSKSKVTVCTTSFEVLQIYIEHPVFIIYIILYHKNVYYFFSQIAMMSSLAGFGYDIGIEAEDGGDHEGKLPSLVYIAWENGDDVKKLANFFTLTRGAVAVSEAQCITHKVYVIKY